ncbi:MAG: DUF998 domain-containing protein [Acidimicrobiales bacterium]|nr:DUF998 domain-containing protein [Acidimicrobiales bacterium]
MRTRSLLACGVAAGPVFVGTYALTGRRAAGYDRRRDAVSMLARTDLGWTQTLNFLVTGSLMWAGAAGLRRTLGSGPGARSLPALVAAAGSGLLGAGLFATDTPEETQAHGLSRRGRLHVASAVPFFVGLPAAGAVSGLRFARQGRGGAKMASMGTAVLSMVAATMAGAGFGRTDGWLFRWGGFFQRIAVASALAWVSWFCWTVRSYQTAAGDR